VTSVAAFLSGSDDPEIKDETTGDVSSDPVGVVTERVVNDQFVQMDDGQTRPVCQEPNCDKPCRKRRNSPDFFPYCAMHNAMHTGSGMASPKSQSYEALQEKRAKSARDVEEMVKGFFLPFQVGLMASGDAYCATALGVEVPPLAKAIGDISMEFRWIQTAVETTDKVSSLVQLAFHFARLCLMVSVHHQWIPYEGAIRFVVPPPDSVRMSPNGQPTFSDNGDSFT